MTTTVTPAQREAIVAAFADPALHIVKGLGSLDNGRCTIAEINLILTGRLSDGPHPCVSEVVRRWVIRVQDAMPDAIRNSAAWREAAVGIAGSASTRKVEAERATLLLDWMWARLGDETVLATVPAAARPAWDAMLTERTAAAAYAAADAAAYAADAAYAAADAAAYAAAYAADAAAYAAAYAAAAAVADAADAAAYAAYWQRADCPGMLAKLVEIGV